MQPTAINFAKKFSQFDTQWSPRIIAQTTRSENLSR